MLASTRLVAPSAPVRHHVVVAEDDPEMRRVIVDALRADGHEVDQVENGMALIIELSRRGALQKPPIDLVISDVRMPGCSGLTAIDTIRRFYGAVPVLLLTAFGDADAHAHARALGAILLDKPVALATLRGVIADLLRGG